MDSFFELQKQRTFCAGARVAAVAVDALRGAGHTTLVAVAVVASVTRVSHIVRMTFGADLALEISRARASTGGDDTCATVFASNSKKKRNQLQLVPT